MHPSSTFNGCGNITIVKRGQNVSLSHISCEMLEKGIFVCVTSLITSKVGLMSMCVCKHESTKQVGPIMWNEQHGQCDVERTTRTMSCGRKVKGKLTDNVSEPSTQKFKHVSGVFLGVSLGLFNVHAIAKNMGEAHK